MLRATGWRGRLAYTHIQQTYSVGWCQMDALGRTVRQYGKFNRLFRKLYRKLCVSVVYIRSGVFSASELLCSAMTTNEEARISCVWGCAWLSDSCSVGWRLCSSPQSMINYCICFHHAGFKLCFGQKRNLNNEHVYDGTAHKPFVAEHKLTRLD